MGHTPGPWHVGHLGSDSACQCASIVSEGRSGSICQISVNNGKLIGDGGNDAPPLNEAVANMHLIAAAPELLEEIEGWVKVAAMQNYKLNENRIEAGKGLIAKIKGLSYGK